AGAVDHLGGPGPLQIALLHRRERAVHDHESRLVRLDETGDLFDLSLADVGRWPDLAQRDQSRGDDVEIDRAGEPDCLVEPGGRRASFRAPGTDIAVAQIGPDDDRTPGRRAVRAQRVSVRVATARLQSDLFSGRRFLSPFEQLDRMTRHDRRYGVL